MDVPPPFPLAGDNGGDADVDDSGDNGGDGKGGRVGKKQQKTTTLSVISPFFDARRNKNIGATIPISQKIPCLPYAGFLKRTLNYNISY